MKILKSIFIACVALIYLIIALFVISFIISLLSISISSLMVGDWLRSILAFLAFLIVTAFILSSVIDFIEELDKEIVDDVKISLQSKIGSIKSKLKNFVDKQ